VEVVKMYCRECGTKNEDTAEFCKKCKGVLVRDTIKSLLRGHGIAGCPDRTVGLLIISVGVVLGIAAALPLFLIHSKDLVTLERMKLIVSMSLGFIALTLFLIGGCVYYGCQRRNTVLQKVQEDYRAMVENASDGIFTIDQGGRFTFLNKKALEMVGYTKEELVGSNFVMIVAPEYRASTIENFKKRLTGEAVDRYEIEVVTKKGERVRVELSTKALEHNGEFMGVEGIAREVVDKRS
jgi:PAS domain S-box-containing protein